jgi:hypothetical protein
MDPPELLGVFNAERELERAMGDVRTRLDMLRLDEGLLVIYEDLVKWVVAIDEDEETGFQMVEHVGAMMRDLWGVRRVMGVAEERFGEVQGGGRGEVSST